MKTRIMSSTSSSIHEETETEPPGGQFSVTQTERKTLTVLSKKNNIPISPHTRVFIQRHFPLVSYENWNDWHWQLRNSITSYQQLISFFRLSENELSVSAGQQKLPLRITPYYASLLDSENSCHALRRTMIPVYEEFITSSLEKNDPLGEFSHSPIPNLVHRYPDRVLFLVTEFCAAYCRYCTRSHMVSKKNKCHSDRSDWDQALDYIRAHHEVRDVLLSGGDPLTLPDYRLEYLLSNLRTIPHVEIIRIGTKVPVVLPHRITKGLVGMLRKYHPLFMSIHFTHPDEITPEAEFACKRLADVGIPLGSQSVLLKGINDDVDVFKRLTHNLLRMRIRPYYLYQCDPIPGSSHFRTPVSKGIEMIRGLRGYTSGYAVPHYVIDSPGGGGKIPILPDYMVEKTREGYLLINYEGKTFLYPEEADISDSEVSDMDSGVLK